MVCNGSSDGVTGSARATLAGWAKVVKWLQSLQLQFKAYQRLNLNKKEKRPLCIGREGRARLRSSTSVRARTHTHKVTAQTNTYTDIKTQTLKGTQTITSRHTARATRVLTHKYTKSKQVHTHTSRNHQTHTHAAWVLCSWLASCGRSHRHDSSAIRPALRPAALNTAFWSHTKVRH